MLALGLISACGDDSEAADGQVTLTVATFNEFGYEELIKEWNAEHDDIKIKQVKVGTWDDAKANLYTKLAAGVGAVRHRGHRGRRDAGDPRRVRRLRRPV